MTRPQQAPGHLCHHA